MEYRLLFEHKPSFGRITVHIEVGRTNTPLLRVEGRLTYTRVQAARWAVDAACRPWQARPADMELVECRKL